MTSITLKRPWWWRSIAKAQALGFAEASGLPYELGLIRNHYVGRTFIDPAQRVRDQAVRVKFNPVGEILSGKRVVVVDDSIVRGTTSRKLIRLIRKAGATEVHFRVGSPPIEFPCFYGIDIATHDELIAAYKKNEEIRKSIKSDTLGYQKIDGLIDAIGMPREDLCLGCLMDKYPTSKAQELSDRLKNKIRKKRIRYWEDD